MQKANRVPLCKFINNCKQFRTTKKCAFSHDRCRFKEQCNDKYSCKFYHPQIQGKIPISASTQPRASSIKAKQQNFNKPCKYGKKCQKYALGTCKFSHDDNANQSSIQSKSKPKQNISLNSKLKEVECKFGVNCTKNPYGKCPYKHSQSSQVSQASQPTEQRRVVQNSTNIIKNQRIQNSMVAPRHNNIIDDIFYNEQLEQFQGKKLCQNFAMGECVKEHCQQSHQLTIDNSLKRLFMRNMNQVFNLDRQKILMSMFKINQRRIFVLTRTNLIAFYELDQEFQTMKLATTSQLKLQSPILHLRIIKTNEGSVNSTCILFICSNGKFYVYHIIRGVIQSIPYANPNSFVDAVNFSNQNLIFIGNQLSKLMVLKDMRPCAELDSLLQANNQKLNNLNFIRRCILFQQDFLVLGTQNGYINLINEKLQFSHFFLQNYSFLDGCVSKIQQKPFLLVVSYNNNQRRSQVLAINLLNFNWQVGIVYENQKISKICCIYDRVLIGIDQIGVIVYSLPDLRKIKGRIPLKGKIGHIEGDQDGNLLIQQIQPNNLVSIFKVRK